MATFQTSFNGGVWDEKLYARPDIERAGDALRQGTNLLLRPQGGAYRRGGLKYLDTLPGPGRVIGFKFSREQEYLLVITASLLEVYEDELKITQVTAPWDVTQAKALNRAQSADTMIFFHEDVAPRRLLRSTLADSPISTDGSTTTVKIEHPAHGLADATEIGISGIDAAVGGVPLAELNTNHVVSLIEGALANNPVTTTNFSNDVVVAIAGHEFVVGDRVEFEGLASTNGIPSSDLNRVVTITAITAGVDITFVAANTGIAGTGGGAAGSFMDPDRYEITVTTASTSAVVAGGTNGRAWSLSDLSDTNAKVRLDNLPQFDFEDEFSPERADEVQKITFDAPGGWATGDKFRLSLDGRRTGSITYDGSDTTKIAAAIQDSLRALQRNSRNKIRQFFDNRAEELGELTVAYDEDSAGPGGGDDYLVTFSGIDGLRDWPLIQVEVRDSAQGIIGSQEVIAGGSQEENIISAARGWPRSGVFFQGRLWMVGLKSRPVTVLASRSSFFFDFHIGDALDGDAISASNAVPEPILHITADRELFILTAAGEVSVGGELNKAITPTGITFDTNNRYGSTTVAPITVGGRPLYVDRTNRNIRQFNYSFDTDSYESSEISIFSQQLISTPLDMSGLRNLDGDYAFVVMSDGSIAALIVNTDQSVFGWTKLETAGTFEAVAVVDDEAYVMVLRTINGSPVRYLEKFDLSFFTDAAEQATGSAQTAWTGFAHLEGEAVQVRGDDMTLNDQSVVSGAITSSEAVDDVEVGLQFVTTLEPFAERITRYSRVVSVEVDLLNARAVLVDGFKVKDRRAFDPGGMFENPPALISGLRRMIGRGWGERSVPVISQTEPQPLEIRGLILEIDAS